MRQPGDKVGHYIIRALLGRGGMGEVYEAEDVRLGRRVALKLIPSDADGDASERMMREARAAAGFEHRNVVLVLDVGIVEEGDGKGETYLAMELVRGRTLRALIRDASVPIGKKLRWLVDVARALSAGHSLGLVHRDIKPDNLMVRDDGVIKVLDFGIAKKSRTVDPSAPTQASPDMNTLTKAGSIVGTPRYASPEQLRGEPLDGRADQYAWGATAYELLSGRPPFEADDPVALLSRVLSSEAPKLEMLVADLPAEVAQAITKSLSKRADERFATLDDAADVLEPFADAAFASFDKASGKSPAVSIPPSEKRERKSERAPASVVVRAAKTSFRVFFWVAAALGTVIILALVFGALTGKLRFTPPSPGSGAPSAAAATKVSSGSGLRCTDATVTGEGASKELARMLGVGACARLAVTTGRCWGHEQAREQGVDLDTSPRLDVKVSLGPSTRVTLRLGDLEASGESASPVDAVETAVKALAPKVGSPPTSPEMQAEWGASSPEGARRIERVWRGLLVGDLKNPEADARELTKTDGDSPWSHAILAIVALRGSKTSLDALAEAEKHLDKLGGARKEGLGALVRLLSKPNPDEAMRGLRKAYDDAPDDADIAGLYAALAVNLVPTEEGFAVVDRLAQRFPTRAILALENAVTAAPRKDLDRDQRYLARLVDIVPDAACYDIVIDHRLSKGDLAGARELLATCKQYFGSASEDHGLMLKEARIDLLAGEPALAHELAAKRLGDPRPAVRAQAAQYVIGSLLLEGRVAEAEETVLAELKRDRDAESLLLALQHGQVLLRLHRRLGTKPPDDVVSWLADATPKATFLPERGRLSLLVEVALARPNDTKAADEVLAAVEKLNDPSGSLEALPLVRARRGDKAAVELYRSSARASDMAHLIVAVETALALEAQKAGAEEIVTALAPLRSPETVTSLALDRIAGDVITARVYDAAKKPAEAAEARARVEKTLTHADRGLEELLTKIR